ncbi:MAG: M48 family metalloprotease [Dactylosporangium sp.]|nr:M48 family metalloprotease [Dactylosporangium sp.]NNJ62957.1 M48 family metalloprotease [Dactylosporangium sp.]
MTSRWFAVGTLVALLISLVVITIMRVPLTTPPAPRTDQLAALDTLPADAVARGRAFHAALRPGSYGALVLGLLVALVLGLTPLGSRLVEFVGRPFGGHWLGQALLGGLAVVFIGELATLPIAAWQHRIVRRYGLSTQDWGAWGVDVLKSYAIGAVIGAVAVAGFFTITRLAPRWWWAPAAACAAVLVVLVSFVYPVLVEPVFNRFTPMAQGQLRDELTTLAERDGVPVRDVLVADASRRTRAVNAYVSGFGPTRRIVVYDTLLGEAPPAEISSVVAHELGHARDRDVLVGTLLGALGAAAAVVGLYLLGSWGGLLRRAGVDSLTQPRAVALIVALVALAGLAAGPVQAGISRRIEARADAHALTLTRDPATFEAMQARLSRVNLGDPDPPWLEHLLFGSHPSTVERMAAARAWARGAR